MKPYNKRQQFLLIESEKEFQSWLYAQSLPGVEFQMVRKEELVLLLRSMRPDIKPIVLLILIRNSKDEKWSLELILSQLQMFSKLKFLLVLEKSNLEFIRECLKLGNSSLVLNSELKKNPVKYLCQIQDSKLILSSILMNDLLNKFRQPIEELLRIKKLTPREVQVLNLIAKGCINKEIKFQLNVSENTVKSLTYKIYKKLKVRNRVGAVRKYFNINDY